jgi:uncharacterized protein (DUF1697 family)
MTTQIALLRAVNLPAHNKVAMAGLRQFLVQLGLTAPRTLLQSGNAVFGSTMSATATERLLEVEAARRLGLRTDFVVRSAKEWQALMAANPFPDAADRDPAHLVVMCLKARPAPGAVTALQAGITGRETVRAVGRQAYIIYPDGIGNSRLTTATIEKALGTRGTGRNWNTVLKLHALAREGA